MANSFPKNEVLDALSEALYINDSISRLIAGDIYGMMVDALESYTSISMVVFSQKLRTVIATSPKIQEATNITREYLSPEDIANLYTEIITAVTVYLQPGEGSGNSVYLLAEEDGFYELNITSNLTLDRSSTYSRQAYEFLKALQDSIFEQDWAIENPSLGSEFYFYVITDTQFDDLLKNYPYETTLEALIERVKTLAILFPGFTYIFDFSQEDVLALGEDIYYEAVHQRLVEWIGNQATEHELRGRLESLLKATPSVLEFGSQEMVLTPFKQPFETLLEKLYRREELLYRLQEEYWAYLETLPADLHLEELRKFIFAYVFSRTNEITEDVIRRELARFEKSYPYLVAKFNYDVIAGIFNELIRPLIGDERADNIEENLRRWTAKFLTVGMNIANIGTQFQQGLIHDPLNAIAGMLVGMVGTASGAFLLWDIIFFLSDLDCDNGDCVPRSAFGERRYDMVSHNEAFAAGMAIGEFGMSVSQILVSVGSSANNISKSGWTSFRFTPSATGGALQVQGVFGGAAIRALAEAGVLVRVPVAAGNVADVSVGLYGTYVASASVPPSGSPSSLPLSGGTTPGGTSWQPLDQKKARQAINRGWTLAAIEDTLDNPYRTITTVWRGNSNEPATLYYRSDGNYIVRVDRTGEIVQFSDVLDKLWVNDVTKLPTLGFQRGWTMDQVRIIEASPESTASTVIDGKAATIYYDIDGNYFTKNIDGYYVDFSVR